MKLIKLKSLCACFVLLESVIFSAVSCADVPMEQISSQTPSQLLKMVTRTSIKATGGCGEPDVSDIKFFLYTRNNPNSSITLNPTHPIQVNSKKKIIVLIHGWISSETCYGFPQLKDAYLKRYDCNVIMVDWSKIAWLLYPTSVCYLPKIGQIVTNLLCVLHRQSTVDFSTIHLVGHSLGAQMSGLIGQKAVATCKQKIGRITGMDPAGPLYQELPKSDRLDKADAIFVDVIHTNQAVLGYVGDCGHADFYVNCGVLQPGCPVVESDRVKNQPVSVISCDHYRTVDYMAESINSNNFKARPCKDCPTGCSVDRSQTTEISMGENCPKNSSGAYVLNTASQSPFAQGSQAPK